MVSATMNIYGGAFSTKGGLDDLTYASIDVGGIESGKNIIIQIWYSRDGSILNNGNYVPITVTPNGFINVRSADAYQYFPDHAEINIYDASYNLLASQEVNLSPSEGIQTFGIGDYDHNYIEGSNPDSEHNSKSDSAYTARLISSSNSESNSNSEHSSNSEPGGSNHKIDVTTSDTFHFFPIDCFIANEGYCASIVVDGNDYYLGESEYDKLCEYSNTFAMGMINQYKDTSTTQKITLGKTGTIKTPGEPVGDFDLNVDKKFSFNYKIGKVGLNKKAYIVTSLYLHE